MKKIASLVLIAGSFLLAQGQLPRSIRSHLESALTQASQRVPTLPLPLTFSHARTANLFKPDSFWVDTFSSGSWTLGELTTYQYDPAGVLLRDSNYVWSTGWQIQAATQYYYYTQGAFPGADSLHISFNCNPTCASDTKTHFSYTPLSGTSFRANQLTEEWNGTSWDSASRATAWYRVVNNSPLLDSAVSETYASGSWSEFFRYYLFYNSSNNIDSVYLEVFAGIFKTYTKLFYDSQGRLSLIRDTSVAMGSPSSASETYYFYDGTSTQPSRDSTVKRNYDVPNPPQLGIERSSYAYDGNGNTLEVVHDTCQASQPQNCGFFTIRERYRYTQFTTAVTPTFSKQPIPSVWSSGATVEIPAQSGRTYRLYDSAGRLLRQGTLSENAPTPLTLPTQLGLYILQIDQQAYRLLVLP